ncbi:MAG: hypothetical protein KGL39_31430 [Patescibacteria group bacterium]|nr:hypothetical protein [Patescibacteria group bacterium]
MTTKTVYLYDTAGALTGSYAAQASPLDPGKYIEPIDSTEIAPPAAGADEVAVFSGGAWTLQPDYRGQTIYNQTTGASQEVTAIGAIPSGFGLSPPPPTLAQAQTLQSALMKTAAQAATIAGFASSALGSAYTYGCQPTDQSNINTLAPIGGNLWCENSSGVWALVAHTATEAAQVQKDMATHSQAQQATYVKALSDIAAATTVAAVEAVTWTNP